MKELSIKEKAKRYDEVLAMAKECITYIPDEAVNKYMLNMFPELKESGEEKLKKEMLQIAKESEDSFYMVLTPNKRKMLINWLEKQEQSKKTSIWKHWKNGICGNGEGKLVFLIKSGATYSLSSCLSFECDYIELSELENLMLEKQDKQNSNIIWHDVSEEPEEQREIFCKWKGSTDTIWHDVAFYHSHDKTFWNGEHQIEDVIKWAYVDEIIKD